MITLQSSVLEQMEFYEDFLTNAAIILFLGILWRRRWLPISRSRLLRIENISLICSLKITTVIFLLQFIYLHLYMVAQRVASNFCPTFCSSKAFSEVFPHLTSSLTYKWPNAGRGWNNLSSFSLRFLLQDLGLFKYWIKMITHPKCYSSVGCSTAHTLGQMKAMVNAYSVTTTYNYLGVMWNWITRKQRRVKRCSVIQDKICCSYWDMTSGKLHIPTVHVDKNWYQIWEHSANFRYFNAH